MVGKRFIDVVKDPLWLKVLSFSLILFFLFLGDAILSFWVPNLLEDVMGDSLLMGVVMSFSSMVGFVMDLVFPQLIQGVTVKRLVAFSAGTSILFSITLLAALKLPVIWILLLAMAIWGVYYEFFGFAEQQFIADTLPIKLRSSGWAFYGVFKNLAYFLGPLIAAWLVIKGEWAPATSAIFFVTLGAIFLFLFKRTHDRKFEIEFKKVNVVAEIGHWKVLFVHVWPMVLMSLVLGLIDSTFWTTGTVFTEKLARENFAGSFFLSIYQLPSMFMGLVMSKLAISQGKKKLSMKFLFLAGLMLMTIGFVGNVYLVLAFVLLSSIALAVCYPLVNAVYSDIVARMGRERRHLIGLTNSAISVAYIIGPILAGFVTKYVGDEKTFSVMGGVSVVTAVVLLLVTPKKLKLPESEIKGWDK